MPRSTRVRRLIAAGVLAAGFSAGVGAAGVAGADAGVVRYSAQGASPNPTLGIDSLSGIDQLTGGELPAGSVVVEQLPPLPMTEPESARTPADSPVWTATPLELGALGLALLVLLAGGYGLYLVVGRRGPDDARFGDLTPVPAPAE